MAWQRWEREAERARHAAPAWFDMERLPWWLFMALGLLSFAVGIDNLFTGESAFQRVTGVALLALVGPAQFLTAHRRRRGIPLTTPLRSGRPPQK